MKRITIIVGEFSKQLLATQGCMGGAIWSTNFVYFIAQNPVFPNPIPKNHRGTNAKNSPCTKPIPDEVMYKLCAPDSDFLWEICRNGT